jgi:hypothetical protein
VRCLAAYFAFQLAYEFTLIPVHLRARNREKTFISKEFGPPQNSLVRFHLRVRLARWLARRPAWSRTASPRSARRRRSAARISSWRRGSSPRRVKLKRALEPLGRPPRSRGL